MPQAKKASGDALFFASLDDETLVDKFFHIIKELDTRGFEFECPYAGEESLGFDEIRTISKKFSAPT